MLPQELMQMPANRLIVLRPGLPAVRGRKIVYWRERLFTRRQQPAPVVPPHSGLGLNGLLQSAPAAVAAPASDSDLRLDLGLAAVAGHLEPLPPQGATETEMADWVERYIDASVRLPGDPDHGR